MDAIWQSSVRWRMSRRRSQFDHFAQTQQTHWLVIRDMFHAVIECTELPPGADLKAALLTLLDRLVREGWTIESDQLEFATTFWSRLDQIRRQ